MKPEQPSIPIHERATYRHGRAIRLSHDLYAADIPLHLTICAESDHPFADQRVAEMVCTALERTTAALGYRLYAYCLMPNHLHVLVSPHDSETQVADFLRRFKSFTTRQYQKATGIARLWQYSARDRLLRPSEDSIVVAAYIANNPVRRGLVEVWNAWPYTKVLIE
jgi:REP element-mobilizing transposase RayT